MRRLMAFFIAGQAASLLVAGAAMLWPAGRLDWWPAWAVLGVWAALFTGEYSVLRSNPTLLKERLSPPKDARAWDRALVSAIRLIELARYILAGFDQRYGWTGSFPQAVQVAALGGCIAGAGLFVWALASNPFFSQVVRIQTERGHAVAAGGPYRFMRHPAYAAMITFDLSISALLASWAAILAGTACAALFVVRTSLEDRTLQAELPGYADYARRVRWRLAPGVW